LAKQRNVYKRNSLKEKQLRSARLTKLAVIFIYVGFSCDSLCLAHHYNTCFYLHDICVCKVVLGIVIAEVQFI